MPIKSAQAKELGEKISQLIEQGEVIKAYSLLAPVLAERTPFPVLGLIGEAVGTGFQEKIDPFLTMIASHKTEGGWVVIGTALGAHLSRNLSGVLERAREYIISANIWYGADIIGERVPGPALLLEFTATLEVIQSWKRDKNFWVRRTVGVAAHFWAKRTRGEVEFHSQARELLDFLSPMFWEWEMSAVKGVGWGLKTIGRYYPEILSNWLMKDILPQDRRYRALMLQKAITYLPQETKDQMIDSS